MVESNKTACRLFAMLANWCWCWYWTSDGSGRRRAQAEDVGPVPGSPESEMRGPCKVGKPGEDGDKNIWRWSDMRMELDG